MQEHTSGYCRHNDYIKYLLKIYVFWAPLQHCGLLNMIKIFHVVILPKCIWHLPGVSKYLEEKMEEKIPEFTHTWFHVMTHCLGCFLLLPYDVRAYVLSFLIRMIIHELMHFMVMEV